MIALEWWPGGIGVAATVAACYGGLVALSTWAAHRAGTAEQQADAESVDDFDRWRRELWGAGEPMRRQGGDRG